MSKKAIIIAAAIIAVLIAIVAVVFIFNPFQNNGDKDVSQIDTSKMADELDDAIPGMDKDEIEDVLNREVTDEQKDLFEDALGIISLDSPKAEDSEIVVDEEGNAHYTDKDGNEVVVGVDEHVTSMTEEELDDEYEQILLELQKIYDKN